MKINQIRCFKAVCKNMSFTKAAEEMYISQPAVSSTIRELEDEFGVRLFNRQNMLFPLIVMMFLLSIFNRIFYKQTNRVYLGATPQMTPLAVMQQ